jgi:phage baseplate assembly protein W
MPYKNFEITGPVSVEQNVQKRSQFYKGFSSVNVSKSGSRLYDFDLIKQDIINQFNTKRGERVMNPNFGSIIWDLLMEPLTDAVRDELSKDISAICNSDPRVTPTQIKLTEYDKGYVLELTLSLNGTDQSTNLRLSFDQKIGLSVQ